MSTCLRDCRRVVQVRHKRAAVWPPHVLLETVSDRSLNCSGEFPIFMLWRPFYAVTSHNWDQLKYGKSRITRNCDPSMSQSRTSRYSRNRSEYMMLKTKVAKSDVSVSFIFTEAFQPPNYRNLRKRTAAIDICKCSILFAVYKPKFQDTFSYSQCYYAQWCCNTFGL